MITKAAESIFVTYGRATDQGFINYHGSNSNSSIASGQVYGIKALTGTTAMGYFSTGSTTFVEVGFGDTPETENDYYLADGNKLNTKLTCTGYGRNAISTGELNSVFGTFQNNTNDPVTVKEVALMGNPTSNALDNNIAMFFRKVLDTPVTIQPGESYMFWYNVRFKH